MNFDWVRFLIGHGIEYVTRGPNIAKDNIGIRCPWCGDADQSHHLGISLVGKGWGCWRQNAHRGVKPHRLIQALISCSYEQAAHLVGENRPDMIASHDFGSYISNLVDPAEPESPRNPPRLSFPPEIRPLAKEGSMRRKLFLRYLQGRGYPERQALEVATRYHLRFCIAGAFRYRLIFPIRDETGLVSWTGRSIDPDSDLRYRVLSADPEKAAKAGLPVARHPVDHTLWNYDELMDIRRGQTLVVSEGPFDAMRIDFFGEEHRVRATCVFTKNVSEDQIYMLEEIAGRFKKKVLLLDPDAAFDAFRIARKLERFGFITGSIPTGLKDPALLSRNQVQNLFL